MTWWLFVVVLLVAEAVVILVVSWACSRMPETGLFHVAARASGVMTVIGSQMAVLAAFIILMSLQAHRAAADHVSQEAVATTQLFRTTVLLPDSVGEPLRGDLACYARTVVNDDWGASESADARSLALGWIDDMSRRVSAYEPADEREKVGYSQWFAQDAERRDARRARISDAGALVPGFLWMVLVLGAVVVIGFTVLVADPRDGKAVPTAMVGAITAMLVCSLSSIAYLSKPFEGSGALRPTEMQRTLDLMDATQVPEFDPASAPCDATGVPTEAAAIGG